MAAIQTDHFSVRWTDEVQAMTSEPYTCGTVSDDGIRAWIAGQLVIDHWNDHAPATAGATCVGARVIA